MQLESVSARVTSAAILPGRMIRRNWQSPRAAAGVSSDRYRRHLQYAGASLLSEAQCSAPRAAGRSRCPGLSLEGPARGPLTRRPGRLAKSAGGGNRTHTGCEPHRILNPAAALKTQAVAHEGAQEGASAADAPPTDSHLARVTAAWASLPDHIRAAIMTLVNSAKEGKR